MEKRKSFGQSIRVMHGIVNSYPTNAFIGDNRKDVVEKMDAKYSVVDSIMKGIKNHNTMQFEKVSYPDTLKFFYSFLDEHAESLRVQLKLDNIEYLWTQGEIKQLMDFLKRNKTHYLEAVSYTHLTLPTTPYV